MERQETFKFDFKIIWWKSMMLCRLWKDHLWIKIWFSTSFLFSQMGWEWCCQKGCFNLAKNDWSSWFQERTASIQTTWSRETWEKKVMNFYFSDEWSTCACQVSFSWTNAKEAQQFSCYFPNKFPKGAIYFWFSEKSSL